MKDEVLKMAAEFDKRFTSMNGIDVPERVSVPRDEWRALNQALKQALAAPTVQEPVAWMDASGDIYKHELWPDWNPPHTPLYTTPPAAQRQWVGLTQEDIDIAFDDTQEGGGFNEFAYAIEKRLKEKNT